MTSFLPRPVQLTSRSGFHWLRLATFIAMAAFMTVPRLARAHPPCCVQCVNPHGHTIPSAGSLPTCTIGSIPTTNAFKAGENPDGFFLVGTTNGEEGAACGSGTSDVVLIDLGTGLTFAGPGPGSDFFNGTTIKYTQAPGTKFPDVDKIGSTNGQAGAVEFHLKGAGDLEVCSVEDKTCITCLVPPPPK
jgi:hypothetical protein